MERITDLQAATMLGVSIVVAEAIQAARAIPVETVRDWCQGAQQQQVRHDTLDSMLDPTRYMRERDGVDASAAVATAYLSFRETVERVVNCG